MFTRLANLIIAYPRRVFSASIVILMLALTSMVLVAPNFSTEFELGDSAESQVVADRMRDEFGISDASVLMVFSGPDAMTDPSTLLAVDESVASLASNPEVQQVITPRNSMSPALIAEDGQSVLVIAPLHGDANLSADDLHAIEANVTAAANANGLQVQFGGWDFIQQDINHRTEAGLLRAEIVSIPIALVVLLLVFGSLVAAGMPLVTGLASIVMAMSVIAYWSTQGFQSIFAINVVTMLGLGLGIDYSLFLVKRYRDELRRHSQPDALRISMQTVGKAIFFSGITVILGLGATQFFDMPPLRSLGQAGMIVTASTMFFGLTLLPATLQMLGSRINNWRISRRQPVNESGESAFWARVAHGVMARPVLVLVATLGFLSVLAAPVLNLNLVQGGADILPASSEPRQVTEHVLSQFPRAASDPIYVVVDSTDESAVETIQQTIEGIDGVTAIIAVPQSSAMLLEVSSAYSSVDSGYIVEEIRSLSSGDVRIQVGGMAAFNLDSQQIVREGLLPALLFVFVTSYIVLMLTFGSVFLPLKAMLMSALSVSASLGVVVWIFQSGNLESLFNFQASGGTVNMVPILIACVLFGLSMDYEVLLLSRIQEEYEATGNNTHAIATGLAHTGQVVSGAATIMVAVFGGFVLADIVMIKSLGFGLAFAVLLDATIVRGVLVPTTMKLMGNWNWWAPGWIKRVVDRLGMSHAEPRTAPIPTGPPHTESGPTPIPAEYAPARVRRD